MTNPPYTRFDNSSFQWRGFVIARSRPPDGADRGVARALGDAGSRTVRAGRWVRTQCSDSKAPDTADMRRPRGRQPADASSGAALLRPTEHRGENAVSPPGRRRPPVRSTRLLPIRTVIGSGTAARSAPQRDRSVHPDPEYRFWNMVPRCSVRRGDWPRARGCRGIVGHRMRSRVSVLRTATLPAAMRPLARRSGMYRGAPASPRIRLVESVGREATGSPSDTTSLHL